MPTKQSFFERLGERVHALRAPLIVGLDPRKDQLPAGLLPSSWGDELDAVAQAYKMFCFGVIDSVVDLVPAVKPQLAFFEQLGPAGMRALSHVVRYAREKELLVVLDGKRNDIGSTAEAYAEAYLGANSAWGGDALTVNPYLGEDSLVPFVKVARAKQAGIFTLVKTSNPGSHLLQDRVADGRKLYCHVAELLERLSMEAKDGPSQRYGCVGAVVGATYPEHVAELRSLMPSCWFLLPGMGAQGGTAANVVPAFDDQGSGAVVNSSRAIIFAHARPEFADKFKPTQWQDAVRAATEETLTELRDAIGPRFED